MNTLRVERYGRTRFWAVREADETLLCVCVYKRGALAVLRRLQTGHAPQHARERAPARPKAPGPTR